MEVRGQKSEVRNFFRRGLTRVVTVIIFATEGTEVTEGQLHAGDDALSGLCFNLYSKRAYALSLSLSP